MSHKQSVVYYVRLRVAADADAARTFVALQRKIKGRRPFGRCMRRGRYIMVKLTTRRHWPEVAVLLAENLGDISVDVNQVLRAVDPRRVRALNDKKGAPPTVGETGKKSADPEKNVGMP